MITCDQITEPAFQGEYTALADRGTYLCRQCDLALFRSENKFHSGCGV
ncbi:peptide-methionine (R)-S-oxide reductase [Candidatus Coxiella mudrowiae]|nr:peptide-methionine (R)-S-oxide reductase [Candidatus Coxiella mudrowiae]